MSNPETQPSTGASHPAAVSRGNLRALSSLDAGVAAVLAGALLAAGSAFMVVGVCGVYHDDAIYVATAKALAQGEGYRLVNFPGAPFQTKYPILQPLLLAGIWKVWPDFPANLLAMQGLSLAAGAASVALSYLYLVRFGYCSRFVAGAAGLLALTSPFFLYFCTQVLSELPFAVLTLAALWALERYVRGASPGRGAQLLTGALLSVPLLCRSIGTAFVPAGLLAIALARRPVLLSALAAALVALPWLVWSQLGAAGASSDGVAVYYTDYRTWWLSETPAATTRVMVMNAFWVAAGTVALGFQGLHWGLVGALPVWRWLVLPIGALPWLMFLRPLRHGRVLAWFALAYLAVLLIWPWPPRRFLVPFLPIWVAFLLLGIGLVARPLSRFRSAKGAAWVAVGLLVVLNLRLLEAQRQVNHQGGYPLFFAADAPNPWPPYQAVFAWLRSHSEDDDVVASGLDTMVHLYTGRPSFRPFEQRVLAMFYGVDEPPLGEVQEMIQALRARETRYVVRLPMPGFSEEEPLAELLEELEARRPPLLRKVYSAEDGRFEIFEVLPEPLPAPEAPPGGVP